MPTRTIPLDRPIDLRAVLGLLVHGLADPTIRVTPRSAWRVTRTPDGPAAVSIVIDGDRLRAEAWGPGADRALDGVPGLVGLLDDLDGFRPELHPVVRELDRRRPHLRLGRTGAVFEAVLPAVLEQKVTGREASTAYRGLLRAHGDPAPGPAGAAGMRLQPSAEALAALPYYAFHPFGVEQRRAEVIRRAAAMADRLAAVADGGPDEASRLAAALRAIPGIGAWTAAEVTLRALGDPDSVSVGDFHTKHVVSYALAGEPRGTDERMLELLEPWRGHRGRVVRLLELEGIGPPRRGPRLAPRSIAGI